MIRGTTPTHVFSGLPVFSTDIKQIWVTYQQGGKVILVKDIESVMFDDNLIANNCAAMVYLSQQDTLSFKAGLATVQIRLLLTDGTAMASGEIPLEVGRVTKDGEIY